jgi:hypothetical protein
MIIYPDGLCILDVFVVWFTWSTKHGYGYIILYIYSSIWYHILFIEHTVYFLYHHMNIFTDMLRLTSFPSDIRDIRRGEGGGRGERSVRFLHLQSLWLDSICMESICQNWWILCAFFSHLCKVHYFLHRYIRHMLLFTNYMFGMYIYPRVDEHRCEKHGFHDLPMEYDYSSIASCTV